MDDDEKLAELLDLARSLGIEVRLTPAAGLSGERSAGALVRLKEREILMMDPTAPVGEQLALAAQALAGRAETMCCYNTYNTPISRTGIIAGYVPQSTRN